METTLTMAGQQAVAGAPRLLAGPPVETGSGTGVAFGCPTVPAHHAPAAYPITWTKGAFSIPTTSMVLDRKNRPTRLLPERSP